MQPAAGGWPRFQPAGRLRYCSCSIADGAACFVANDRETLYALSTLLGHDDDDTKAHGCSFVDRSQG